MFTTQGASSCISAHVATEFISAQLRLLVFFSSKPASRICTDTKARVRTNTFDLALLDGVGVSLSIFPVMIVW